MKKFDKKDEQQLQDEAASVFDRHRDEVDALESAPQAESAKPTLEAVIAMGSMLDRADEMMDIMDEATSVNTLGKAIRRIIKPVIVGSIAQSPIAAISSVQSIDSRVSAVFAQKIIAGTTRGNMTKGDVIADAYTAEKQFNGYASGEIVDPAVAAYAVGATAIAFTLPNVPVLKGSVQLTVGAVAIKDAPRAAGGNVGDLISAGLAGFGTIDYSTGAVSFTLLAATAAAGNVAARFVQELDNAQQIPEITFDLSEIPVVAAESALAINTGHFGSIEMRKKFGGEQMDAMLARELVAAVNSETFSRGMRELSSVVVGAPTVNFAAPTAALTGVSRGLQIESEWRKFLLACETASFGVSGGFVVSSLVCGRSLAAQLMEHPKFIRNSQANLSAAHVAGTLDGIVIVREPRTGIIAANAGYALTKGMGNFRDSLVFAPYLPVTSVGSIQNFNNPLQTKSAVATSNGYYAVPNFSLNIALV